MEAPCETFLFLKAKVQSGGHYLYVQTHHFNKKMRTQYSTELVSRHCGASKCIFANHSPLKFFFRLKTRNCIHCPNLRKEKETYSQRQNGCMMKPSESNAPGRRLIQRLHIELDSFGSRHQDLLGCPAFQADSRLCTAYCDELPSPPFS